MTGSFIEKKPLEHTCDLPDPFERDYGLGTVWQCDECGDHYKLAPRLFESGARGERAMGQWVWFNPQPAHLIVDDSRTISGSGEGWKWFNRR